jgi:RimJ/RimL family protein N-acetyltransferase
MFIPYRRPDMELYTSDLILRTVTPNDIEEVARMWAFENGSISMEEARRAIEYMENNHLQNKKGYICHLCFAVFEKGKNKIIGWCGLDGSATGKLYIFYSMDTDYRNRGFATQSAATLVAYAFEEARVPFINGGCDKDNKASYKVMEKIGMKQDGFEDNGNPMFFMDAELYRKRNI